MVKINSTILRTIKDDATGATTSIRLFGKTFGELKNVFGSIKTNGLFKANIISDEDIQCVKDYNYAIKDGIPHQQAMEQATKGASDKTKQMIKNANGNTIALNQMTLGAKAASVAMNVLSTAANMLLITAITKGVEWLVTYNKRLEETRQEMIETGKEVAKLTEDLDGLIEQYRKLGEDGELDNSDREQAYNIQQQINELLGDEVEYINLANGEYKEQLELLKRLQHEKANDNYAKLKDAKDASEESLEKATFKGWDTFTVMSGFWSTDKESKAVQDLLQQTEGMAKYLSTNGGASFKIDISNSETIVQSYEDMIKLRNILSKSYEKEIEQGGVLEDFYDNLVKKIDSMSDAVQKYKDAMSDYNINEAVIQFNEKEFGGITGALIDSKDAMSEWMNKMISSKKVTDGVQIELISLAKTWYPQYIEQINKAINAEATKIIQDSLVDKSLSGNIESLKAEATSLGLTESAMMSLVLAEINFNKNNLNVSQKVSALKELATWAGVAQAKMDSIFGATSKSKMSEKEVWAERNGVTINRYADKDGTHTYTYNGKTYSGVNAVNEALLNEAIQSQIDSMNNIKVPPTTTTSGGDSSPSPLKDTKEDFDWIETKISRLQRTTTNFGKTVSATWKSWTDRNSALKSQISAVTSEINLQQQAADKYWALANGVGLSSSYKELVRNGSLNISTIKDENTINAIKQYQEYYENYLSALDAKQDAEDELRNLKQTSADNISTEYDDLVSFIEHEKSILDSTADILENNGYMASASIYDKLIQYEYDTISTLEEKYKKLNENLNNSGIQQGTEQWNDMKLEILEVEEAILESKNALVEYNNTLRDLEWEVFDKLQEKISGITEEADFLIKLMSDEKMFDEGKITEHGQATLGLYVLNYKTYLAQAEEYGQKLEEIREDLKNDPYNQTLIDQEKEWAEALRDSILASEDALQSIVDLKQEGYDSLLESLDTAIDKYKDLINEQKNAYDYQKQIDNLTGDVTKYQKIMKSLQGMENTEEGKKLIQEYSVKLKDSEEALAEAENEKYLEDLDKLLQNLSDDATEFISQKMDNVDALVKEVIAQTETNTGSILETLKTETSNVGTSITQEMESIWGTNGTFTTSLNSVVDMLKQYFDDLQKEYDTKASEIIASTPSGGVSSGSTTPTTSTHAPSTGSSGSSSSSGWGSWFVSKTYAKQNLNPETSIVDRLKSKNINADFSYRSQYYRAMGGSGIYTGSASQNRWMLAQMKSHGFAQGGTIGNLIKATGEDGFVLARKGEGILTPENMKMLENVMITINPIMDSLAKLPSLPDVQSKYVNGNTSIGDVSVTFDLPNVKNYSEFMTQMQNDPKFEGMILHMAFGKNSMDKYKYKWN